MWTSYADKADWIFCLVRTSSESKQGGISFLLFDMETPGVSTRPILLISGNSPFCETFFDDVKVPKDQIVGEVNKGWDVAKYLLGHEREMISGMGLGGGGSLGAAVKPADPLLRAEIAAFDVDALAFQAMSERFTAMWKAGEAHPASPSMMKYAGTELNKRRNELVMAAGGRDALEWDSERSKSGKAPRDWLRSKGNSIEGGTSEIQLNIVAKHILRLPGPDMTLLDRRPEDAAGDRGELPCRGGRDRQAAAALARHRLQRRLRHALVEAVRASSG